jgi:ABC-type multidrug transport system fused ATPase/permease subunit
MIEALRAIRSVVAAGRPPVPWAIAAGVSLALVSAIGTLPPILTGRIVDALQHGDARGTMQQLAAFAAITIVTALLGLANTYATGTFRESIARNLRIALMQKLLRAKLGELERLSFGEVANRLSDDLDGLCFKFEYSLFPTISSACLLIATLAAMFAIDRWFAAISCGAAAISVLPARFAASRYAQLQRGEASNHDARAGAVSENATLGALAMLRHPRAAARQLARYAVMVDAARDIRMRGTLLSGVTSVSTTFVNLLGPVAVLSLGAYLMLHHATTVGTIVIFLMYQSRLYAPFSALSTLPLQIAGCGVYSERVLEIADLPEETSGTVPFTDGDLVLDDVTVVKGDRAILKGAGLTIRAGSHVALVGPSGAGKSTLGGLILRLHDPAGGRASIGGRRLDDFDLRTLRESIVVVPQDPLIFDTTLWENLTYLNPEAPMHEVERAIEICALRDVVTRLPERYQARLGQRGFRLSGGERQRVCLARALVAQSRFVIMDEALTGVDVETEARIIRDLRHEYRGRGIVVITHRLHSVVGFDRIVVVEDGRVTAQGTHDEARAASPWYREASETARLSEELAIS